MDRQKDLTSWFHELLGGFQWLHATKTIKVIRKLSWTTWPCCFDCDPIPPFISRAIYEPRSCVCLVACKGKQHFKSILYNDSLAFDCSSGSGHTEKPLLGAPPRYSQVLFLRTLQDEQWTSRALTDFPLVTGYVSSKLWKMYKIFKPGLEDRTKERKKKSFVLVLGALPSYIHCKQYLKLRFTS